MLALKTSLDADLRAATSRIEKLELRIRRDEEGLREITRVVTERGASARAVQLGVFPMGNERATGDARQAQAAEFSFIP